MSPPKYEIDPAKLLVARRERIITERNGLREARGFSMVFGILAAAGCAAFIGVGIAGGALGFAVPALTLGWLCRGQTRRLQKMDSDLEFIETVEGAGGGT